MARTSDTAERTLATAWTLLAEGVYPSAQTIRERIRQGSMTTINQALKNDFWPAVAQRLQAPEVPPALAELTQQLWQRALESADDTFADYRREIDDRLALSEAEKRQALDRVQQLEADLQRQAEALRQQRDQHTQLLGSLEQERAARRDGEHRLLEQAEALNTARLTLTQTEQRLHNELAVEKQRNDANEQRLTQLYDDQKSTCERLEQQLQQQTDSHRQQSERQHREIEQLGQQLAQLRDRHAELQTRLNAAQAATAREQTLREQLQGELARSADTLAQHRQQLDESAAQRAALQQRLDAAERERAGAERETEVLVRQLDVLTDKLGQRSGGTRRRGSPNA